jgi:hypothetical protein
MAADSAASFATGQVYDHADKIVNLVKGLPIGVMTCGAGGIGNASVATLLKDLRMRLAGGDSSHEDWKLDSTNYTLEAVTARVQDFFSEKAKEADLKAFLMLRICGYSAGKRLPEVWQVACLDDGKFIEPCCIQKEADFGTRWNGEQEPLNRLIQGVATIPEAAASAIGLTVEQAAETRQKLVPHTFETLIMNAAPIQDAIDLTRFLVETTKGFIRFSITRPKTVGGAVEIAAITKHEGFKWVQRKHFFHQDLNV